MILQNFKNTLVHKDGRYEVSLPWKEGKAELKDNYKQAENRLYNLERKYPDKATYYREAINNNMQGNIS